MENSILKVIADNPALLQAVKETILAEFDVSTISLLKMERLSNNAIGELARAQMAGVKAVEDAFLKIEKHKTIPAGQEKLNPAR
jgi:hypothetical protein